MPQRFSARAVHHGHVLDRASERSRVGAVPFNRRTTIERRLLRLVFVGGHVAADDAGAEEGVERSVDRGCGGGTDELDRLPRRRHLSLAVDEVAWRVDDRFLVQRLEPAQHVRRGKSEQVFDLGRLLQPRDGARIRRSQTRSRSAAPSTKTRRLASGCSRNASSSVGTGSRSTVLPMTSGGSDMRST